MVTTMSAVKTVKSMCSYLLIFTLINSVVVVVTAEIWLNACRNYCEP